jgi:hypothetical protein
VEAAVAESLLLFHPMLGLDEAQECLDYEDWVLVPNGPFLSTIGDATDAWGRQVRLLRSDGGDLVNDVVCGLTGMHFAHARGPRASNITLLTGAALVAADHPRLGLRDLVGALETPMPRASLASALAVEVLESTPETTEVFARLLADPAHRVAVAERFGYRCLPEQVSLIESAAAEEADAERRGWLDLYARAFRAVLDLGPGAAALGRVADHGRSPFVRRLLEVGPPGHLFVTETSPDA